MSRLIGCVYPELAMYKFGVPKESTKEIDLSTIDGVYLDFIFATFYFIYENVYLVFDANLRPYCVRIVNTDGKTTEPWNVSDADTNELNRFAKDFDIETGCLEPKEIIRNILIRHNKTEKVFVPYYRV